MKRKSYYINPGNIKSFELIEEEIENPNDDEVQIEVKAIGLNFAEVFSCLGLYQKAPKHKFIPGLEYSGIITKVGNSVEGLSIGDRIMGVRLFGSYTTVLNVNYKYVTKIPDDWSFEDGASYLVQGLTAYYGLVELGRIKKNEIVLINSAAGGVGIFANRIAKKFDCTTIGSVGNKDKVSLCEKEGYDHVIVRDKDFKDNVKKVLNGRDLNLVMESNGGKVFEDSLSLLPITGRMMIYGYAYYMPKGNRINYLTLIYKYLTRQKIDIQNINNQSFHIFNLIYLMDNVDEMREVLSNLNKLDLGKQIIGEVFSFEELPQAILKFKEGKTVSKIVVRI